MRAVRTAIRSAIVVVKVIPACHHDIALHLARAANGGDYTVGSNAHVGARARSLSGEAGPRNDARRDQDDHGKQGAKLGQFHFHFSSMA